VTRGGSGAIEWGHSSFCNGGACVEVRPLGERVEVRDSENPGNIISFSASNWRDFVAGIKNDEFGNSGLTER
jgi:hypothetical protein